ncbi:MAG: hypothetical protein WC720_05265 [Candidatus Shapirobacteria bacterium]|jgi:hypothetical protein
MINTLTFIANLLNKNIGVVTFLVGSIAIYLYIRQKKDHEREAAHLILQEIRYAEKQMRKYKEFRQYKLSDRLLPTNNWNENINLFVKDLKETDIDLINDFYAKSTYIDIMIRKISDWKTQPLKSISISSPLQQPSITAQQGVDPQIFQPIDPMQSTQVILNEVSDNIEFIYNTPVVEKLRKISEKRKYHLI